jgi:O-antigen/teichoic acid export membrane protein
VGRLFVRPTKFILFVVTPLAALFIFFPTEILSLWLGKEFAIRSHDVLVLLAAGFFFNCLAHVPLAAMLGLGRPDLKAKIDIAEALTFVAVSYFLISYSGITGAALAKGTLLLLDVVAMFVLAKQIMKVSMPSLIPRDLLSFALASGGFLAFGLVLDVLSVSLFVRVISFFLISFGFVLLFVAKFLTVDERELIPFLRRNQS